MAEFPVHFIIQQQLSLAWQLGLGYVFTFEILALQICILECEQTMDMQDENEYLNSKSLVPKMGQIHISGFIHLGLSKFP
jgi:hypothetical protein